MLVETMLMLALSGQGSGQLQLRGQADPAPPARAAVARPVEVFRQVYGAWSLACDDPGFLGQRIQFDVSIDAEGRIIDGPILVRPRNDAGWRRAAESARRALLGSAPFDVPPDFAGGSYRPTFNTSRACALAAEADED